MAPAASAAVTPAASAALTPAASPAAAASAAASPLVPATGKPRVVTSPAGVLPAANQDGACNSETNGDGDFCLWFSTNFVGSLSDYFNSDPNLGDNRFLTPGLGLGQVVANDSESALNADTRLSVVVFTGVNGSGAGGTVAPRAFGNFNASFVNNVESFRFM
jgi:Peptidase inhibitor family I36